jgi:hypothetical protein
MSGKTLRIKVDLLSSGQYLIEEKTRKKLTSLVGLLNSKPSNHNSTLDFTLF